MSDIVELLSPHASAESPPARGSAGEPTISLIAAMSLDRTIGRDGELPWRLSADLAQFKAATMGKPVIVGRKTYDNIGRPLPGRALIVMTRSPSASCAPGVRYVRSIEEALTEAKTAALKLKTDEIFVAGGAEVYHQTLPMARRILLTVVDAHIQGEARFPDFGMDEWTEADRKIVPAGPKDDYKTTVIDLRRP